MKIMLIQLTGRGGTQLYVSRLANALSKKNNDVTVLLGSYLFDKKHYINSKSKIILIESHPSYLKMCLKIINPFIYLQVLSLISKYKPDVFHLVFEDLLSGIIFSLLKNKVPILVVTEHDPSPHLGEKFLAKLNQETTKLIVRKIADRIIVHGDHLKSNLIDKGVACDKVFVVPHGDYSYYTEWSKGLIQEKNTVLFFGLIREYKGLEYLIRAVPTISSSIPELKVIIAGDGDFTKYESLIDNTAHFEIHNRFIPDEEVSDLFERASVVVLPYTEASQSGVVPIAYAFKKPVVATNVGSLIEVVEDGVTGFVVPPRNTEALSDAIIKILENECLRKKMGENGYENMKKKMSWEEVAQNTVQIYNKMCI